MSHLVVKKKTNRAISKYQNQSKHFAFAVAREMEGFVKDLQSQFYLG